MFNIKQVNVFMRLFLLLFFLSIFYYTIQGQVQKPLCPDQLFKEAAVLKEEALTLIDLAATYQKEASQSINSANAFSNELFESMDRENQTNHINIIEEYYDHALMLIVKADSLAQMADSKHRNSICKTERAFEMIGYDVKVQPIDKKSLTINNPSYLDISDAINSFFDGGGVYTKEDIFQMINNYFNTTTFNSP